ncbi:histidine kinase [Arthrobacter phage DanielleIgnace]|nr:histidine kinase [Arthrobacter phage DanielleIgnace]
MIDVESAGRALEAYTGKQLVDLTPEEQQEALQDVLTDLEHLSVALGLQWPEYRAHIEFLYEAGRCQLCGMTAEELLADAMLEDESWDWTQCAGFQERSGDVGEHQFGLEAPLTPRTRKPIEIGEDSDS